MCTRPELGTRGIVDDPARHRRGVAVNDDPGPGRPTAELPVEEQVPDPGPKLEDRFETPDGRPRHPDMVLSLLRLETAMVNADQDKPGFWDNI